MDRILLIGLSVLCGALMAYGAIKTAERIAEGSALHARASQVAGLEE